MKITFTKGLIFVLILFILIALADVTIFASEGKNYVKEHETAFKTMYVLNRDMEALQKIVSAEARGEGIRGQELVVEVILNRVASSRFPNTIYEVIHQKNAFEPVTTGVYNQVPITQDTITAINNVIERGVENKKILFFQNKYLNNSWADRNAIRAFTYKNHRFYTLE